MEFNKFMADKAYKLLKLHIDRLGIIDLACISNVYAETHDECCMHGKVYLMDKINDVLADCTPLQSLEKLSIKEFNARDNWFIEHSLGFKSFSEKEELLKIIDIDLIIIDILENPDDYQAALSESLYAAVK